MTTRADSPEDARRVLGTIRMRPLVQVQPGPRHRVDLRRRLLDVAVDHGCSLRRQGTAVSEHIPAWLSSAHFGSRVERAALGHVLWRVQTVAPVRVLDLCFCNGLRGCSGTEVRSRIWGIPLAAPSLKMWGLTLASCGRELGPG